MSLIEVAKPNPLDGEDKCADGIFCQWERDGRDILRLFGNDHSSPKLNQIWEKILSFDPSCQWGLGERKIDVAEGIRKSHSCRGCRLLDFLTDLEENPPGTEFIIESGPEVGKKVYLQEMRIHRPSIKIETISTKGLHPLLSGPQGSNMSQGSNRPHGGSNDLDEQIRIESDPLTSEYLNTLILRQIFAKERLDPIQKIYTAFICQDRGFLLKEALIPLDQIPDSYLDPNTGYLRSDLVYGLFVQLVLILKRLRDLNVVFSKVPRLYLSTMPFVYRHQGKVLSYPLTLKLGDLGKTSLTYKVTPSIAGSYRLLEKVTYPYPYHVLSLPKEKGDSYRLNESNLDLVRHLHRLGFPVYPSSINYLLLLALLSEPKIGKAFFSNPETKKIWDNLWLEDSKEMEANFEKRWNPEQTENDPAVLGGGAGVDSDLYQLLIGRNLTHQPLLF